MEHIASILLTPCWTIGQLQLYSFNIVGMIIYTYSPKLLPVMFFRVGADINLDLEAIIPNP
jgi:hypothetical protein